jgi:hypothetical protein
VKTYEDTKVSRSIVSDTLQSLKDQTKLWHDKINLLEAGQHLGKADTLADLGKLLDVCQNLRDAILSEDNAATWKTKEELHALVERLDDVAGKRRRYLALAQLLAGGTVSHRRERTKQERLAQRDAAVAELMEISALAAPPDLPGPAVEEWLDWACNLEDGTDDSDLQNLKINFPRVDDFVRQLEIELWQDGPASTPHQISPAIPTAAVEPDSPSASSFTANTAPVDDKPSAQAYASASLESSSSVCTTEAPPAPAEEEEQKLEVEEEKIDDLSTQATNALEIPKYSFFDADEVENLSCHLEKAKKHPKKARDIRALVAISHWLLPREQNPALHPSCGIRSQLRYAGYSDLVAVSPDEANRAIKDDERLLLFTGGADLLRWQLAEESDEPLDGIAAVRRLTVEQIRGWFVELFKIALSEPQIDDIYRLTRGIPLLVGEFHRLIIPVPEAPPTWLGYAIWTETKSRFERRLAALAQELRSGSPAVRLTDREISLLKMVVIASDYSTSQTIASNLMEDWYQYHLPELPAMTESDEAGIALLQTLGLLPSLREPGISPIQAILPVDADDAIRKIVSHL